MRRLMFILALTAAAPAAAQDRTPDQRDALTGLARVMGESHAFRQACFGAGDQHWRARLADMLEHEQPDEALAERLKDGFAAGLSAGRAAHPVCSPATRQAQIRAAERGRALALQLGTAQRRVPGWQPTLPGEGLDGFEEVTPDASPS